MTDFQILLDLDGLLVDMSPFAYELDDDFDDDPPSERWFRFFDHLLDAKPVPEGAELVAALHRLKWQYSISTTRPGAIKTRAGIQRLIPPIQQFTKTHLAAQPRWVYTRNSMTTAVDVKRQHFHATANEPQCKRRRLAVLFVDDDEPTVDELCDQGVPALSLNEIAGLTDAELRELLRYTAAAVWRVYTATPHARVVMR